MKESSKIRQPLAVEGFGARLAQERREKAARDRRDLTQADIAKAIGSSGPSVSRWEAGLGVPSDRMVEALARYFGVTPAWLRYGQEPREAPGTEQPAADTRPASGRASGRR